MRTELLLIDDDPFALAFAQKTARCLIPAHKIRIFSAARDAIAYLTCINALTGKPADRRGLICSDLEMPEMNGFEFLDEFAQLPAIVHEKYKVFILSSTNDRRLISRLYEKRHFEGYCPKPLTVGKLKLLLRLASDR